MSSNPFVEVFRSPTLRKRFYPFLDNVLRIYPGNLLDGLIRGRVNVYEEKEKIYKAVQGDLHMIQSGLQTIRRSVSALSFQRQIILLQTNMLFQTEELLRESSIDGGTYVEIGTKGRYWKPLRKEFGFNKYYLVTDQEPGRSPTDILERAGFFRPWQYIPLTYEPITAIAPESADLVSIYIGVHHGPADKLDPFISSVAEILRPKGNLILREHDCNSPEMNLMASLAHDIFDVATGVTWEEHSKDVRNFHSIDEWKGIFGKHGLKSKQGGGILQSGDPSLNTLVRFEKQ